MIGIFRLLFLIIPLLFLQAQLSGQYSRQDSLRGSVTAERNWWDLIHYHLSIEVNPSDSSITGSNTITYKVLEKQNIIQIDLQTPLSIDRATQNSEELLINSEGNAHFIQLKNPQIIGSIEKIKIEYSGKPHVAIRAPWDGGISWKHDANGKPFVASSCQGIGASIWWPCKDHMYDEPDSMLISVTAPQGLMNVSNGQLVKTDLLSDGRKTYHWAVTNPINNYGVNLSIGDYVHFGENYDGLKGLLKLDYYVLRDNIDKAKDQFKQVPLMMKAFEHWFGPYPFYEDGFKLIEVPYLGMEHQSAVTYGNGYQNGYLGKDLSGTGWGLKFDFIIVHEAGHEWFANNITYQDMADMWIHESFTAYSECLFLEYYYGKEAGADYVIGTRRNITNDDQIIGDYEVNNQGSGDMYYKGSNMLHTLRQIVNNDEKWRQLLIDINDKFYHQTVTSSQIENYISEQLNLNLTPFFNQYLRSKIIPILEYTFQDGILSFRWTNAEAGLDLPVKIYIDGSPKVIKVGRMWRREYLKENSKSIVIDRNYYIGNLNTLGSY